MTKAKMIDNADGTRHEPAKPPAAKAAPAKPRLHLREVRTVQAADGSLVHHHTYADHKDAQYPHPERPFMATSSSPEEAGQHVSEMFGQNGMSGGGANEEAMTPGEGTGEQPQE